MQYMWLAGSKKEVEEVVKALKANGFTFELADFAKISNSFFGVNRRSYTLKNFRPPAIATPQPRPWDAVLGGKR
jgi:hypothetical protein